MTLHELAPETIKVEDNVRFDLGDLTTLVASVRRLGVIQPVLVTSDSNGSFTLVAGHRRRQAAIDAEVATIPAYELTDYELDDLSRIEAQYAENVFRQDLTPVEKAQAMLALSEGGMGQRDIAKVAGVPQRSMKGWLKLARAGRDYQFDAAELAEEPLLELASEVDEEYIAPTVLSYLENDSRFRSLEDAYAAYRQKEKDDQAWAKINDVIAKLKDEGVTVVIGERYARQPGPGAKEIVNVTDKDADEVLSSEWQRASKIVLDVKAHRNEDCHLYWVQPPSYRERPRLGEWCLKPKRHDNPNATVHVPNAAEIKEQQDTARAKRKKEREARDAQRAEIGAWLDSAKLTKAEIVEILVIAAEKTQHHDWEKNIVKLLGLETDGKETKWVKKKGSSITIPADEHTRALDAYTKGMSEAAQLVFFAKALVAMDAVHASQYGYTSRLAQWYKEHQD